VRLFGIDQLLLTQKPDFVIVLRKGALRWSTTEAVLDLVSIERRKGKRQKETDRNRPR